MINCLLIRHVLSLNLPLPSAMKHVLHVYMAICMFFRVLLSAQCADLEEVLGGGGVINSNLLISRSKFTEKRPRIPPPLPLANIIIPWIPFLENFSGSTHALSLHVDNKCLHFIFSLERSRLAL